MGHSGDDAIHKGPHKIKTYWQNQLKSLVLVYFIVLYRIRHKKIDAIIVQCPFKGKLPPYNGSQTFSWGKNENHVIDNIPISLSNGIKIS